MADGTTLQGGNRGKCALSSACPRIVVSVHAALLSDGGWPCQSEKRTSTREGEDAHCLPDSGRIVPVSSSGLALAPWLR